MPLYNSHNLVLPLAVIGFFCILVLTVTMAVIGTQFSHSLRNTSDQIQILQKRISDLEAENDYLFEGKESMMNLNSDDVTWEESPGSNNRIQSELSAVPNLCFLKHDQGPCGSRVSRWFYDQISQDCHEFTWGGCRGNDNNFLTIEQCRAACKVDQSKPIPKSRGVSNNEIPAVKQGKKDFDAERICQMPPDAGPCKERIPRFFHSGGKCLKFSYGGCAGNQNNFFTEEICRNKCIVQADICHLLADPGSGDCEGSEQVRYFFNLTSSRCEQFVYLGCGGNQNNFAKMSKCEKRCLS